MERETFTAYADGDGDGEMKDPDDILDTDRFYDGGCVSGVDADEAYDRELERGDRMCDEARDEEFAE